MKIFLADLVHNHHAGDNQISGSEDFVVPLNVGNLSSFIKSQLNDAVDIKIFKYPQDLLDVLKTIQPDIIGFSSYIWNAELNIKLVNYIKELYPNIVIAFGGPTIRTEPKDIEKYLQERRNIDAYILYEGERPFLELVKQVISFGINFKEQDVNIPSTAYLTSKGLKYQFAPQNEPVEHLPSPYLDGTLDEFLDRGLIPLFETNRGCPFKCSYCIWGVAALNKVRKFSLEDRILLELDHVASNYPKIPSWIIADANFGMMKRDVEIAQSIRHLKDTKATGLKHILTWESKNTTERNFEISKIMNNVVSDALVAVQTLDKKTNDAIKRGNISQEDTAIKIDRYKKLGANVQTHLLSNLPEETYDGQVNSIRKAFEFEFDDIQIFSIILLPGSEMESGESREKYKIKTKYRLRAGGYGRYSGITAIDCEEIIRSNSAITEEQTQRLRSIHWLIWFGWNHGFLKPIWKIAHKKFKINPIEIILILSNIEEQKNGEWKKLLTEFDKDSSDEWFNTREELEKFYEKSDFLEDKEFDHFLKAEFKYNAKVLLNKKLYSVLIDLNIELIKKLSSVKASDDFWKNIKEYMLNSICFPEDIYNNRAFESKIISIDSEFCKSFLNLNNGIDFKEKNIKVTLYKNTKDLNKIIRTMSKNYFEIDKIRSVVKTLGSNPNAFSYQKTTNLEKQETGDITTTFNNNDMAHDKLNKFQNIGIKLH
jgi:radical SAM superfamily enzyme YgiQ (UPF0313 family)